MVCADTDERAEHLAWTLDLSWVRLRRGRLAPLASPKEAMAYPYTPEERALADAYRALLVLGSPQKVRARIEELAEEADVQEVMISTNIYSHEERLRSYELVSGAFEAVG